MPDGSTVIMKNAPSSLATPTDLDKKPIEHVTVALNTLMADVFALYLKTKNFHWHMSGPHFRDWHLMLDGQAGELLAMTDVLAERVRKLGGLTLHSIGEIARYQRVKDNDDAHVRPHAMLAELRDDNGTLVHAMRKAHAKCEEAHDIATASVLETFVDETERRTWFLFETTRDHTDK